MKACDFSSAAEILAAALQVSKTPCMELAQKLGQLQPYFIAVFPPECVGQITFFWANLTPFSLQRYLGPATLANLGAPADTPAAPTMAEPVEQEAAPAPEPEPEAGPAAGAEAEPGPARSGPADSKSVGDLSQAFWATSAGIDQPRALAPF